LERKNIRDRLHSTIPIAEWLVGVNYLHVYKENPPADFGSPENAGLENDGRKTEVHGWKMADLKMTYVKP